MLMLVAALGVATTAPDLNVLVYSRTAAFRHDCIPVGQAMFKELAAQHHFQVTCTEDASEFRPYNLRKFDAIVFLCTTGDCLNDSQQKAMEAFLNAGGGYLGIHSAADTEYDWPFYGDMLGGAWFAGHPDIQDAEVKNEAPGHPTMKSWPSVFRRKDEWYNYRANPRGKCTVLASLNESSYQGGTMKGDHPIIWCREVGKGRAWYTGFGHTQESYKEQPFRDMMWNALEWATHTS